MCGKIPCDQHTPEQRKVVEEFDRLIQSKLKKSEKTEDKPTSMANGFEGFEISGLKNRGKNG